MTTRLVVEWKRLRLEFRTGDADQDVVEIGYQNDDTVDASVRLVQGTSDETIVFPTGSGAIPSPAPYTTANHPMTNAIRAELQP